MFALLMVFQLISFGFCEEPSQTVDLGQMSVSGEVRRPAINWIDSQRTVKGKIPEFLKADYEQFVQRLLKPELPETSDSLPVLLNDSISVQSSESAQGEGRSTP